jgi:hypothetical protein
VLNTGRKERLFTIFNNHLKSHFVLFTAADPAAEQARANELRRRQCQAAAAIIATETRPKSRYLLLGDMNEPPDSDFMAPLAESTQLKLAFGLTNPTETGPAPGSPAPPTVAWTERFKPSGKPAVYTLMDQIWLSPALAAKQTGAVIERRGKVGGDGSDHATTTQPGSRSTPELQSVGLTALRATPRTPTRSGVAARGVHHEHDAAEAKAACRTP